MESVLIAVVGRLMGTATDSEPEPTIESSKEKVE